jgi:hypothetical protein
MRSLRDLRIAAVAAALLTGGTPTSAVAADSFGQQVAMCAHQLGQRADAPAVTCTHDGMTMTFANFGAMVRHMREMH